MMKRCKKEYIPFLAGMLVVLLALSRYIVNGEPVDVRSDAADLADGITLSAPESWSIHCSRTAGRIPRVFL